MLWLCLEAEGLRRIHKTIREVDKATHVLHIDTAGPLTTSDDGFHTSQLELFGFQVYLCSLTLDL